MRINHTKRIYMNEEGSSPGGGAPPVQPAPTAAPTAPETPSPLTADAVATIVASAVDAKLKTFENTLFANARKAGLLGKEKPTTESPAPTAPSLTAPASTGLSMADVQALLDRNTALTRVQIENKLTDAQVKRMRSALESEKPEDPGTWASTYLADMGLVRINPAPSTTTTAPVPTPNTAPISDRGSPAPNGQVGWRFEMNNPIGMSKAARDQMDAELGPDVARKQRLVAAATQAGQIRVVTNPRG